MLPTSCRTGRCASSSWGSDDRSATADELGEMASLVEAAMTEGAFGLSTGLTYVARHVRR